MISFLDRVENTVGKGEKAGYQHFLLFPQCFPKPSSLGLLKVGFVWERVLTLSQTTNFWTRPNGKHLQTTIQLLLKR